MEFPKHINWPGWEVVRKLGAGSFGSVYEIERDLYGKTETAALKVISIPQDKSDIEELYSDGYDKEGVTLRFRSYLEDIVREYAMMAEMKGHANIVYCDDLRQVQHDDGIGWDIYIKMELLTPLVRALPVDIPEDQVIRLGMDICNALVLCKERNIIHRDIKPQNIFVSRDGNYKLGDFGIAKTAEKTSGGTKTGTYKYMAPEVYKAQPYGTSADLYSLGLVLYWMLNERRTPFLPLPPRTPTTNQEDEAKRRRFAGEPLPPPAHGSSELQAIVLKACAYDPKNRFKSAAEMLDALHALLQDDKAKLAALVTPIAPILEQAERIAEKTENIGTRSVQNDTVGVWWSSHQGPTDPVVQQDGTVGVFSPTVPSAKKPPVQVPPVVHPTSPALPPQPSYIAQPSRETAEMNLQGFASAPTPAKKKGGKKILWIALLLLLLLAAAATWYFITSKDAPSESASSPSSQGSGKNDSSPSSEKPKPLGTAHSYEFLIADCSWEEAQQTAHEKGGYLACFETEEEYLKALEKICEQGLQEVYFRLGARRAVDSYEYYWVDQDGNFFGECLNAAASWSNSLWDESEPTFEWEGVKELYLQIYYNEDTSQWVWNDTASELTTFPKRLKHRGYIIEYEGTQTETWEYTNTIPTDLNDKVAMITDYDDITDQSYNQTTYWACKRFTDRYDIEFRYYKPSDNSTAARVAATELAIAEGFNIIVMPGYTFGNTIVEVAPQHKDVKFIALDITVGDLLEAGVSAAGEFYDYNPDNWKLEDYVDLSNVYCTNYQEEIAGYMAGYAAVQLGYTKLGFLGGMAVPAVIRYGYGFVQGADAAALELDTDVSMKYIYSNQFFGDAEITGVMSSWYADGTEVVFACGGSVFTSVAEAASKFGGKVIGMDVDQSAIIDGAYGAGMTVTSAMKGFDPSVYDALEAAITDEHWNNNHGKIECLGLISPDDPAANYVQLPMNSTQWNTSFTQEDYKSLVAKLYHGELRVSSNIQSAPTVRAITVSYLDDVKY